MELKILLPGIPAFSSRGYLGWSTVVLLQHKGKNILFDVGGHNERLMLVEKLQEQGLTPESVDMVILSHLHYDHAANINLFPQAELVLGRRELEFAATEEGRIHPFIPLGIADYLQKWPSLTLVEGDEKLAEGLTVLHTPGHSPGGISLLIDGERQCLLTGDAVKNACELVRGKPQAGKVWQDTHQRLKREGIFFITGHDRPFRYESGRAIYEGGSAIEICIYNFSTEEKYSRVTLNFEPGAEDLLISNSEEQSF